MPQLPLTAWHAEQLRLTVFPVPGATTRSAEWWEQVTGESPEEQTANPKKGVIDVSGPFGGGKLLLHLEPERIDWRLVPADPDLETLTSPEHFKLPTCGPFADAMPLFSEILGGHWLARDDLPDAARIAFGAVLIHPEEDRQSGYLRLPDYIPVQVNPSSSDFFFQVNFPTNASTAVEGLQINRLSKWSVGSYRAFAFRVVAGGEATGAMAPAMFAFRLELDINTAAFEANSPPLPKDKLVEIFQELIAKGTAITAQGVKNP